MSTSCNDWSKSEVVAWETKSCAKKGTIKDQQPYGARIALNYKCGREIPRTMHKLHVNRAIFKTGNGESGNYRIE